MLRLSLGRTITGKSDEDRLLEADGYEGARWLVGVDFARAATESLAIGGFATFGWRDVDPRYGGPTLHETIVTAGLQAPLVLGSRGVAVVLAPRFGWATGRTSLGRGGDWVGGLAYGAELGVVSRSAHFGVAAGWLRAIAPAPGDVGRPYDLGGVSLSIQGVLDG